MIGNKANQSDFDSHEKDERTRENGTKILHVTAAEKTLWNNRDFHSLENAPSIDEDQDGALTVTDDDGYIIAKIDEDGITTTDVKVNGINFSSHTH
jgi:hypothetical protein